MSPANCLPDCRLETPRLVLRPPVPEDFEAFAASAADAEVMQYLGGVQPRPVAWRSFAGMMGGWLMLGFGVFSVIEKATGRWVGGIGLIRPEGWPGNEVGWRVISDVQGKGIAYEAAVACMDFAFGQQGWEEVIHCIEDRNTRSIALARRLGSEPGGLAKLPPPFDEVEIRVWSQTRDAWRARRASPGFPVP